MPMRILLADDQPQVRSALTLLLEHEPALQVVGEATYAEDLLTQIDKTQPDLVLLDWELPGLPASTLLRAIRANTPHPLVIALSGRPEAYQSALIAGVDGFISKGHPPEQLLTILHAINSDSEEKVRGAPIKDWMTRDVITVSPDAALPHADFLMTEKSIRRLPVVKDGYLVGIVTRSDIHIAQSPNGEVLNIWELNYLISTLKVERLMTRPPITIPEQATISEAARIMDAHKIGGLPVLDNRSKVVGIITESDIFRAVAHEWNKGEEGLREFFAKKI